MSTTLLIIVAVYLIAVLINANRRAVKFDLRGFHTLNKDYINPAAWREILGDVYDAYCRCLSPLKRLRERLLLALVVIVYPVWAIPVLLLTWLVRPLVK